MVIQEFLHTVLTAHGQMEIPNTNGNVIVCNACKCFNGSSKGEQFSMLSAPWGKLLC